jgi:hypothetical protein
LIRWHNGIGDRWRSRSLVEFVHFDALIFCFFVAQFQDEASTGRAPVREPTRAAGLVFRGLGPTWVG